MDKYHIFIDMKELRKRLFIDRKTSAKERYEIINLAVENECDTLVFSLDDKFFKSKNRNLKYIKLIKQYNLFIEAGGRDLSFLLPGRMFFFHRELFRMEQGKRKKKYHFCPTNPKTRYIIVKRAKYLFARSMQSVTVPRIFHLLPDEGHENTWCACPACRAFSPDEQYIIAVNSAADALAGLDPDARLSFFDYGTVRETERILPRENMFHLV
jgi:hypothetical protein